MKAIIVGAGQGYRGSSLEENNPTAIVKDLVGRRVLDWILSGLKSAKVDDFVFVGGFAIEKIIETYPSLRFYHNTDWENNNVLQSLFYAEGEMDNDFVFSYADIVYKPSVVKKLLEKKADITVMVDISWRTRYLGRAGYHLTQAEKVTVSNGFITKIGKKISLEEEIKGEFIGLAYFSKSGAEVLRETFNQVKNNNFAGSFHEAENLKKAFLTDLLQELINRGIKISYVETEGEWAALDSPQDLTQFIFGTKAETLERLEPLLKNGKICEQVRFEVDEWQQDQAYWLKVIQQQFVRKRVIIRSSAISEDSWESSLAGAFCSVGDVQTWDNNELEAAIDTVINSYQQGEEQNGENQVLVQPQIDDVLLSGVMFTCDLETGAPYYVINYDDSSKKTDTVTSGANQETKTVIILKEYTSNIGDNNISRLIEVAKELETLTKCQKLDIEFAITNNGDLFIFQVRPITAAKIQNGFLNNKLLIEIQSIKSFVKANQQSFPHIYGKTTIFGEMPDWNPAEIIGTRPKQLAYSMYHYLILKSAWRDAREKIGYCNPYPDSLMVSLGGKPYIDVRNSFNSFLPKGLPNDLAEKIINYYLERLAANPEFHDKVEFEVVATSLSFDFEKHRDRLNRFGFTDDEVHTFRNCLLDFTNKIVLGKVAPINEQLGLVEKLEARRKRLVQDVEIDSYVYRSM